MNDWQQQLDRLVDGELSPEAYRGLLAELETRPHGWRDCALAFLEAQALRGEVSTITQADRVPPIITQIAVKTPVKWWSPPIMGLLSLAATLLFVFMANSG